MNVVIANIPQDTEWHRSFNILVPPAIQGKTGTLIAYAQKPNRVHGSIGAEVQINNERFNLPSWAVLDLETLKPVKTI